MADSRTPRSSDGLGSASPAPAVTRAAAVFGCPGCVLDRKANAQ